MEIEVLNNKLECISHDTYKLLILLKVNKKDTIRISKIITEWVDKMPKELKDIGISFNLGILK